MKEKRTHILKPTHNDEQRERVIQEEEQKRKNEEEEKQIQEDDMKIKDEREWEILL